MLTFESFDIEAHPSCKYDYVQVSFGSDEQRYCGSNKPSPIISSDNTMVVIFRSDDHEGHNNGFKATWKAGEPGMSFGHVILLAHFIYISCSMPPIAVAMFGCIPPTTLTLLSCFSAPFKDIIFIVLNLRNPILRSLHFTWQCALRHI